MGTRIMVLFDAAHSPRGRHRIASNAFVGLALSGFERQHYPPLVAIGCGIGAPSRMSVDLYSSLQAGATRHVSVWSMWRWLTSYQISRGGTQSHLTLDGRGWLLFQEHVLLELHCN